MLDECISFNVIIVLVFSTDRYFKMFLFLILGFHYCIRHCDLLFSVLIYIIFTVISPCVCDISIEHLSIILTVISFFYLHLGIILLRAYQMTNYLLIIY